MITTIKSLFLLINAFSLLLLLLIPQVHAKMLIVLIFALTSWSMKILPQALTSLIIISIIPLLGLGSFTESLSGFSRPFVWLLVSAFVFATAMEKTGIGKRVALKLLNLAKGNIQRTVPYTLIAIITLGFFIPTSAGRSATIMPVCMGIINMLKEKKNAVHYGKAIMIGVTITSSLIGWGLMTGSNSSIYMVSSVNTLLGYKWSYFYWFIISFPIMIIAVIFLWFILKRLFPIDSSAITDEDDFIKNEIKSIGKIKSSEIRILIIGILVLAGWITEPFHGLSVPYIALVGSIVTCLPSIGVQTWKEVSPRISWDVIILFGAGVAIADAMYRNQTAYWIASKITSFIPEISYYGAALFIMVVILLLRLGFAEMLAITATVLPITISLSDVWNINPIWLTQIMIVACSFSYFFPYQATSNLISYSYGLYKEKDLLKTGLLFSPVIIVLMFISVVFYWPLMGLSPEP